MRQFRTIFKLNFIKELQYRVAALSGIATQLFFGLMYIMVYLAFYKSNGIPGDFGIGQMATYIWLQQAFLAMFRYYDGNKEITQQIIKGDIAYQMIRPINLYDNWFMQVFTSNYSKVFLRAMGIFAICFFLPFGINLMLPVSFTAFLLFILSLLLGSILVVAINMISYILITVTLSPSGVFGIMNTVASFLAGIIIPIPLMPAGVVKVLNFLPFRYVSDLPFRLYMGNIGYTDGLIQIGIQVVWIVLIVLFGKLLLNKCQNKLVVQGG